MRAMQVTTIVVGLIAVFSRRSRLRRAGQELYDIYHSFKMPDAPQRGEIDAAWAKFKKELDR